MGKNLYEILGVSKNSSETELKKAYKKLSIKWHPDKNPNNMEEATKKFQEISSAYKVLSDPKTKQIYDQFGEEGLKSMAGSDGSFDSGFGDVLGNLFPGFGGFNRGNSGPKKADPLVHVLEVPLEQLYTGVLAKFNINIKKNCEPCEGTGSASRTSRECGTCKGSGIVIQVQRMGPMIQQFQAPCKNCQGKGKKIDPSDTCKVCKGKEYTQVKKPMEFQIYPGMAWGMKMVLPNEGHELRDHIGGDLVLQLVEPRTNTNKSDQPPFKRSRNNLEITLPISLHAALLGFQYPLYHLDGKCFLLKVSGVTKPNMVKIIKNSGMPIFRQDHIHSGKKPEELKFNYGDLIIHFDIEFPENLSTETRNKLNQILDNSSEKELMKKLPGSYSVPSLETTTEKKIQGDSENTRTRGGRNPFEMFSQDSDDESGGPPGGPGGVQCAQQ